jgi:hypothetical protein
MQSIIDVGTPNAALQETKSENEPAAAQSPGLIRRTPFHEDPVPAQLQGGRISMTLDDWLHVDRTLHELRNLVEIAIMQRDEAQATSQDLEDRQVAADDDRDSLLEHIRGWKKYAESLERKLRKAYLNELEAEFTIRRLSDVAEESLLLGLFSGRRKRELSKRLVEVHEAR